MVVLCWLCCGMVVVFFLLGGVYPVGLVLAYVKKMTINHLCNICWWITTTRGHMWSVQIDLVKGRPNLDLDDLWPNHLDQYDFYKFLCRHGPNTVQVQKLDLDGIWTWTNHLDLAKDL